MPAAHTELLKSEMPARCCILILSGARCCRIFILTDGGLTIEGYEMLKGLAGVKTHEHREWLPILENSQNMPELADQVADKLAATS